MRHPVPYVLLVAASWLSAAAALAVLVQCYPEVLTFDPATRAATWRRRLDHELLAIGLGGLVGAVLLGAAASGLRLLADLRNRFVADAPRPAADAGWRERTDPPRRHVPIIGG